jgi:hypothetical protein
MFDLEVKGSLAALYYVASELALQGLVPLPTIKNEKGFDIVGVNPKNGKCVNIQVRGQSRTSKWWSANTSNIPNLVYFFVQFTKDDKLDTFYILPNKTVKQVRYEQKKGWYYVRKDDIAAYERKWKVIEELLR